MMLEADAIQIVGEALGDVTPPKTTQADGTPHNFLSPCLPAQVHLWGVRAGRGWAPDSRGTGRGAARGPPGQWEDGVSRP